ncbi:heparan-alpha-glucosaminide N-acetyltransferase domain-containing protein [Flaviflexus massiliensis]|uniref:heparan-alpha-glucosaminide N-acetyltransferase domain-containing protein n=1 Tax=Flaviflexus massiliensis TaxID=1522309 RepID=UPI0006D5AA65|nr:heparan-alpha-glucosaminide N-acetyltransferase domain-containing protein [Flaviflexus massiliensis]
MQTNSLSPALGYAGRIAAFDIARGLAVLGMFIAHVGPEREGLTGWLLGLADGRSSILFATLAGVSLAILTGRNVPYTGVEWLQAKIRIYTRAAILIVIVAILSLMNDIVALILAHYAAWFVLALPFLRWRPRNLFIAAGVCWLLGPIVATYLPAFFEKTGMDTMGGLSGFLIEALLTDTYVGVVYMGFVFAGIAIGRLDLTQRSVPGTLLPVGISLAIIGYGGGYLSTQFMPLDDGANFGWDSTGAGYSSEPDTAIYDWASPDWRGDGFGLDWLPGVTMPEPYFLMGAEPHSGTIWEALGSGGTAIAIIAALLLGGPILGKVLYPIAAVGSMSLSAYSFHIIAIWAIPALVFPESMWPMFYLLLAALVLCSIWRFTLGRGPFELLMYRASQKATRILPGPGDSPRPAVASEQSPPHQFPEVPEQDSQQQ